MRIASEEHPDSTATCRLLHQMIYERNIFCLHTEFHHGRLSICHVLCLETEMKSKEQ